MVDVHGALAKKIGRAVVVGMELFCLCLALPAAVSAADPALRLNILTSFSPEFYNPFIQAYHRRRPGLQIQVLNKKTTAAIACDKVRCFNLHTQCICNRFK